MYLILDSIQRSLLYILFQLFSTCYKRRNPNMGHHLSHLLPLYLGVMCKVLREVPELFAVGFECCVVLGIGISSDVAQPNVKSSICQDIGKALIDKVCQPVGTGAEQTMLKEENWAGTLRGCGCRWEEQVIVKTLTRSNTTHNHNWSTISVHNECPMILRRF